MKEATNQGVCVDKAHAPLLENIPPHLSIQIYTASCVQTVCGTFLFFSHFRRICIYAAALFP